MALSDLSHPYQEFVAAFRFCPCAERVVESFHKDVKQGTRQRRPGISFASLLLRQRELEDSLDRDPHELTHFLDAFSTCRDVHAAASALCLNQHPDLQHIVAQGLHRNRPLFGVGVPRHTLP